jgi:heme-degrading monooxygenase HmoA
MLAVTTRNTLHNWRFCLPMLRARRSIKEQLAGTPGLVRSVTAVASPKEFLTLTIWENRQAMFNFMSAGAHEQFMWMFSRWSASFWSMRWVPTTAEVGTWDGLSLAGLVGQDCCQDVLEQPHAPRLPLPEQRPSRMPVGRLTDPSGSGVAVLSALVEAASPGQLWRVLRATQEWRRKTDASQLLRWSVGAIEPRRFLVLTMWRDVPGVPSEAVQQLYQRLNANWAMGWAAGEYEIGHWNGLRVRQLAAARLRQQQVKAEASESSDVD